MRYLVSHEKCSGTTDWTPASAPLQATTMDSLIKKFEHDEVQWGVKAVLLSVNAPQQTNPFAQDNGHRNV